MSEPSFAQAERPSLLVPIVLALAALGAAIFLAIRFFPSTSVQGAHVQTQLLATHTVYKSNSIVLGQEHAEDVLFVATTLKLDNHMKMPVYLDDYTLTFTDPSGAQLTARSVNKSDLANLETTFPAIKPLVGNRLTRDTVIQPNGSAQGTLLFSLQLTQALWDSRKDANVRVDIFRQHPVTVTIPKS